MRQVDYMNVRMKTVDAPQNVSQSSLEFTQGNGSDLQDMKSAIICDGCFESKLYSAVNHIFQQSSEVKINLEGKSMNK